MARQASAERAWSAISRFYDNCKKKKPGKKGYPKFKKHQTNLSVEYKTSGWKLSEDRREITFTDGFEAEPDECGEPAICTSINSVKLNESELYAVRMVTMSSFASNKSAMSNTR